VARREIGELNAPRRKEGIGLDEQGVGALARASWSGIRLLSRGRL
jgi:hypothetical protein